MEVRDGREMRGPEGNALARSILERVAEIFGSVIPLGPHDAGVGGHLDPKPRRRRGGAPVLSRGRVPEHYSFFRMALLLMIVVFPLYVSPLSQATLYMWSLSTRMIWPSTFS
jgi:hypothetical protein